MLVEPAEHLQGPGSPEQGPVHARSCSPLYRLGCPRPGARASTLSAVKQLEDAGRAGRRARRSCSSSPAARSPTFAVFALGIMPYITASIIMQILAVVIPKLEQWQQQGAVGQRKITQWTRYLTVGHRPAAGHRPHLPVPHGGGGGFGAAQAARRRPLLPDFTARPGAAGRPDPHRRAPRLLMWMGELITQRGIGNGMSLLIFASVVSRLPVQYFAIRQGERRRSSSPILIA